MISAFLAPYALRGVAAPYLWVFYKLLSSIDEPMALLVSEDYLLAAGDKRFAGREEFDPARMQALGYALPSEEVLGRHHIACLDTGLLQRLLDQHQGNPLAVFKAFLSEEIEELKSELRARFDELPGDLEAVLTWCNCPSLAAVARERGLRVIHLEMGPLREPAYRATAYFDFSGVNGHTEAQQRFEALAAFEPGRIGVEDMRLAFARQPLRLPQKGRGTGVVLQVEDDSNLLCFNNGFDNTALIARALLLRGPEQLLVRAHPGSRFALRRGLLACDTSTSIAEFLALCDNVLTINSSVGLEALLHDVTVQVHGDASFRFIAEEKDEQARVAKLAFYLLGYLVPYALVFSLDYIRFRLAGPDEGAIIQRHYLSYGPGADAEGGYSNMQAAFARMRELLEDAPPPAEVIAAVATAVPLDEGCRLYYRAADEYFSEGASVCARPQVEGPQRRVSFLLPAGALPDFVRFDPGQHPASFELTGINWGWGEAVGEHELQPLRDLSERVSAIGGLSDLERGRLKSFSDCGEVFFECSTGDLWHWVEDIESGRGIIEFVFTERSLELEAAYGQMRVESLLEHLGSAQGAELEKLLRLLEHMSSDNNR